MLRNKNNHAIKINKIKNQENINRMEKKGWTRGERERETERDGELMLSKSYVRNAAAPLVSNASIAAAPLMSNGSVGDFSRLH